MTNKYKIISNIQKNVDNFTMKIKKSVVNLRIFTS